MSIFNPAFEHLSAEDSKAKKDEDNIKYKDTEKLRRELEKDTEKFLRNGGKVTQVGGTLAKEVLPFGTFKEISKSRKNGCFQNSLGARK